jgi:hypothetical protein
LWEKSCSCFRAMPGSYTHTGWSGMITPMSLSSMVPQK